MKTLLTLTLVVLMAGSAFAQLDNSMGLFFVDSGYQIPEDAPANTNLNPTAFESFNGYICVVATTMFSIAAYEVGVEISDPAILVTGATGPNGWTNFGQITNHLVGFQTPVLCNAGYALLGQLTMFPTASNPGEIFMGPAFPSSVDEMGPALADGANVDILHICNYTSGEEFGGKVATLNGNGISFPNVVATEAHSLSSVKALFN